MRIPLVPKEEQPQHDHDDTRYPEHPENQWRKNAPLNVSIDFAYLQTQLICFHQGYSKVGWPQRTFRSFVRLFADDE